MLILPIEQAHFLRNLSKLGIFTGTIGILTEHYYLGTGVYIGYIFAHNYWSYPIYGLRRNLDIGWIQVLFLAHLYETWKASYTVSYISLQTLGGVLYGLSWYAHSYNLYSTGTYLHALVHICAHIASIHFYYGTYVSNQLSD